MDKALSRKSGNVFGEDLAGNKIVVGKFKERDNGDIEIDLNCAPVQSSVILRRRAQSVFRARP